MQQRVLITITIRITRIVIASQPSHQVSVVDFDSDD